MLAETRRILLESFQDAEKVQEAEKRKLERKLFELEADAEHNRNEVAALTAKLAQAEENIEMIKERCQTTAAEGEECDKRLSLLEDVVVHKEKEIKEYEVSLPSTWSHVSRHPNAPSTTTMR